MGRIRDARRVERTKTGWHLVVTNPRTPPPPITLRPLSQTDAPELQMVYSAGADYFVLSTGGPPGADLAIRDLAEAANDDARHILGIYLNDEMAGVLDFKFADPEPFDVRLGLILLAEFQRGMGLGSWALSILEEWLSRATPVEAVVLAVPASNHAAQHFFRGHGYTFTGQAIRVATQETQSRWLFMRKELPPAAD